MMTTLFDVAGLAMIGWALMIFLPGWSVTRRLVRWAAFPVALAVIYVVGIAVVLADTGLGVIADFGSAEGVIGLLAEADLALVAWIHILAFDHLVGVVIVRDNLRHGVVPLPLQSVILFLTLMFGPVGFLTYWLVRVSRGVGPDLGGRGPGGPGDETAIRLGESTTGAREVP
ncbi:MAG: ABA4-like family protein [Gemmatimonadota bacterium]